ncbi:peroxisomal membrane protein pex14 [Ciborinia camelliae]|nr:peroxisomal membrane protein pex14 [Ciborinia camelliae]
MAIREDLVASADPNVSTSPLENRIAFLQSKNLTQEEVDAALGRASGEQSPASQSYSNYTASQQVARQPQPGYGGYQQYPWQQPPPPEVPKRDWRDWFIMATVTGGIGYGAYFLAKRYIYPIIAPPTPPQLEQDKKEIDDSFEKAFSLLDQLAKDTETLKTSEQERTERLDIALTEVETVINELKSSSRRRDEESRRMGDEVRGLKDLIPRAMDGQKEATDNRLKELAVELKSLKTLMGQRMNPVPNMNPYNRVQSAALPSTATPITSITTPISSITTPSNLAPSGESPTEILTPRPASVSTMSGTETIASLQGRSVTPFNTGAPSGGVKIPAWQMAAANKSTSSIPTTTTTNGTPEASGSA